MTEFFRIGKIITLHGIKGEVKVFSTTEDKKRYDYVKDIYLSMDENFEKGTFAYTLKVEGVKYVNENPILKFAGFDTIEDSTKLIGYSIYVDRKNAIKLKENEYYIPDLMGLRCICKGKEVGTIKDVLITKANKVLVIDYDKKDVLVPFVYDFIEKVCIEDGQIYIKTLEGLL